MHTTWRSDLTLLFSLGMLPAVACTRGESTTGASSTFYNPGTVGSVGDDGDRDETDGASEESTSDDASDGASMSTTAGGGDDPSNGSNDPGGDASTDPTNGDPTNGDPTYAGTYGGYGTYGGTYGGDTYGGGALPPVCIAFANHYVECVPQAMGAEPEIAGYCGEDLQYAGLFGPECGAALEDFYSCMSAVPCQALQDPQADPCGAEQLGLVCS
jgi:hypothetical protein